MSDANDWVMTDLRRALLDRAATGEVGAVPESLSVPTVESLNHLVDFIQYYDSENPNLPDDPTQSFLYEWMMSRLESQLVFDAAQQGHITRMRGVAGRPSSRTDATGYEMLVKSMIPAAQMMLIKGPKGSGKSTKAMDIASKLYSHYDGGLSITSNVPTNGESPVEYEENWSGFLEFAKQPGEKLAIIDEASTVMTGYSQLGGADVVAQIGRAINALRKSPRGSLRLIIIGHENDADIHPMVRKQADVVMEAEGKVDEGLIDKASVYRGWQDFKDNSAWFRLHGLQDIPQSSPWAIDTNHFAHLEFDLDDPDNQIRRGKLVDNWKEYQDGGELTIEGEDTSEPDPEEIEQNAQTKMLYEMNENGMSYTQITEATGIPDSTVGDRIRRYRDQLTSDE